MKILAIIALAVLFQPASQSSGGIISGIVTRTDGITPLPEARIEIGETFPSSRLREPFSAETMTDGAGRFIVRNIPAGEFAIRASRDGYLDRGTSITGPGQNVVVSLSGERRVEVKLALAVGATVRGRIVDADNQPIDATVHVLQQRTNEEGQRFWTAEYSGWTNEKGEYRIPLVPPGDYYVRANLRSDDARGSVYFPGTRRKDTALSIAPREGDDVVADIRIPNSDKETTFKVSGRVVHSFPAAGDSQASGVTLTRQDPDPLEADSLDVGADLATGRFEITGVRPGIYDLLATVSVGESSYMSKVEVHLRDRNVQDLTVNVLPGLDVKARLTVEGTGGNFLLSPNRSGASWSVLSDDPARRKTVVHVSLKGSDIPYSPSWGVVDEGATEITFPNVPRGHYKVLVRLEPNLSPLNPDAYIADVRITGRSVYDDGIRVGLEPVDELEVVIGGNGGSIEGTISGQRDTAAVVVLIPDAFRRNNAERYKHERIILSGGRATVRLRGIAPGSYKIFAVPDNGDPLPFRSPEFAARFESRAVPVTVQAATISGVQIPLLPLD